MHHSSVVNSHMQTLQCVGLFDVVRFLTWQQFAFWRGIFQSGVMVAAVVVVVIAIVVIFTCILAVLVGPSLIGVV